MRLVRLLQQTQSSKRDHLRVRLLAGRAARVDKGQPSVNPWQRRALGRARRVPAEREKLLRRLLRDYNVKKVNPLQQRSQAHTSSAVVPSTNRSSVTGRAVLLTADGETGVGAQPAVVPPDLIWSETMPRPRLPTARKAPHTSPVGGLFPREVWWEVCLEYSLKG